MELEKLNKCLGEMDTLTRVNTNYEKLELEVVFNCLSGGMHENVDLVLLLSDPAYYHLPFYLEAEFAVAFCSGEELTQLLPEEFHEGSTKALRFILDRKLSRFYCCFDNLKWSVSGGGSIKNEHELLQKM